MTLQSGDVLQPAISMRRFRPNGLWVLLGLLAVIAFLPLLASRYAVLLMVPFLGFGIALLGFNLLFGYTGLLSFGHAMFIAIGAYVTSTLTSRLGVLHIEIILAVAVLAAVVVAVPVGALSVRYTRIFFGMLTLAFGMLFHSILFKFYDLTGGDQGMSVVRPLLFGMEWRLGKTAFLTGPFFYYCLGLLAIMAVVIWRIVQSAFGMRLMAIRENDGKAAYVGIRVFRTRLAAFVISAVYGSVGGVILAVSTGLADPELAYWTSSGNLVFMALLGGSQTFAGPVVGAMAFVVLREFVISATEYWRFVMGGTLILLVIFLPQGITGAISELLRRAGLKV